MSAAIDEALIFSSTMDQLFDRVADKVNNGCRQRLLCERRLRPESMTQIRTAAAIYLAACLDLGRSLPTEKELLAELAQKKSSLPNLTPNGVLMPKREHLVEYNLLHKSVSGALSEFLSDDLVDSIQPLVNVRIVEGLVNTHLDQRAYATTKLHSDVWAGDALDSITALIPVLGDPRNITVEFKEMPRELELEYMKPLDDYSIGSGIEPLLEYENVNFDFGSVVMFDARLLHQTIRKTAGFRISLDLRFRRKAEEADRLWLQKHPSAGNPPNPYIDYATWKGIGVDSLLAVPESCAEAKGATHQGTPALEKLQI